MLLLQPGDQIGLAGQLVEVGDLGQLVPFAAEEHHQIRADLGVGFDDGMTGMGIGRLQRAAKNIQALVRQAEDHRRHRAAPAGGKIVAVAREQGGDLVGVEGGLAAHLRAPLRQWRIGKRFCGQRQGRGRPCRHGGASDVIRAAACSLPCLGYKRQREQGGTT